jgi:hypothetical protein
MLEEVGVELKNTQLQIREVNLSLIEGKAALKILAGAKPWNLGFAEIGTDLQGGHYKSLKSGSRLSRKALIASRLAGPPASLARPAPSLSMADFMASM